MAPQMPQRAREGEENSTGNGRSLDLTGGLRRYWKIGAAAGLAVLLAGLPVAWWKGAPKYRAEGALYVSPRFLRNLDADPEHELQSNSQYREFVQQQVRTVARFDIVEAALRPDSPAVRAWKKDKESVRRAVDRLRGALQVAPVPDTYQITVGLEGEKPEHLAALVNEVMASYVKTAHRELLFDSEARLRNLQSERSQLEGTINALIEERTRLARELGTTTFSGAIVNSFDRQLGALSEALQEARRQRFVAEAAAGVQSEKAVREADAGTRAAALQSALSDASLNSFKATMSERKATLLTSIRGLSPQHPGRIAAEKELEAIDRETEALTATLRDRLAKNLDTLQRARFEQSKTVERSLDREARKLKEQTESYSRAYQRSLEMGEEIDRVRKRLHAVEDRMSYLMLETRAPGFVRIFSPALRPEIPVEGGRRKLALLVLAAALALALAAPLALDYLDPRLRTPGELEVQLGLPLTGWLPVSPENDDGPALPAAQVMRAAVSIRRHLHSLPHRVLVVSAVGHGGGSTTFCLAVADALERLGASTLVVEANPLTPDPRYGNGTGLLQLLDAPASMNRLAGTMGRIPTGAGRIEDLLPVERLIPWLREAGADRDLVLIDAAPLASSLATEELIRVFGSSLLVVDARRDQRKQVADFLHRMERLSPGAFGAVLNNVDPRHAKAAQGKNTHDSSALLAA